MKKILLTTAITAISAMSANAASTSFNGFYLGAQAGAAMTKTSVGSVDVELAYFEFAAQYPTTNKRQTGLLYGLYGGYGKSFGTFYLGAEFGILGDSINRKVDVSSGNSYTKTQTLGSTAAITGSESTTGTLKYKKSITLSIAPRLGAQFGNSLIYFKPAIEISRDKATFESSYTVTSKTYVYYNNSNTPGATYDFGNTGANKPIKKTKTIVTFAPAIGYEYALGKVLLRAEYTYGFGSKVKIDEGTVKYTDNRFAVGVAYKF